MTGLIDSDVKPVHSVSKEEGLNLLEPASKKEYIKKELYRSKGLFVQRFIAIKRIDTENSNFFSVFISSFLQKSIWGKGKQIFLGVIVVFILLSFLAILFVALAFLIDKAMAGVPGFVKTGLSSLVAFVALPFAALKLLPILPFSPKKLETEFSTWSRNILMDAANPKWINSHLFTAWPLLNDSLKLDPTVAQSHRDIVSDSEEFGSDNSIWYSINSYCHKFLQKWSSVDTKERVPMILWAFNPPNSDSGTWGELRDRLIKQAETQFASEIYSLLYGLSDDGGAIYDEFVQQAEENEKSFEWLKQQMLSNARHEPPCVQLLRVWSEHHDSKD